MMLSSEMAKSKFPQMIPSEKNKCIRILLADDHRIVRSGLRELIGKHPQLEIVAEAERGNTAVQLCRKLSPDIAIMDISMPDLNGIDATKQILSRSSKTKVIILSVHSHQNFIERVFKAGASGYLLKDCSFEEVVAAIYAVYAGETYLHPKIATAVRDEYLQWLLQKDATSSSQLSLREREVLQLIAEGKNTKEIAFFLNLSGKTVEAHRRRIMEKLKIHSVAELTKYAIREGLTTEE
jgi:DNA-binding NarL/FixJ family response regulator